MKFLHVPLKKLPRGVNPTTAVSQWDRDATKGVKRPRDDGSLAGDTDHHASKARKGWYPQLARPATDQSLAFKLSDCPVSHCQWLCGWSGLL